MPRKILTKGEKLQKDWEKGKFDPMDEIVQCPTCGKDVREGDRIWLSGQCTCFECYTHRYEAVYGKPYKWDEKGDLLPEYKNKGDDE